VLEEWGLRKYQPVSRPIGGTADGKPSGGTASQP
jgi:hypothetical protein